MTTADKRSKTQKQQSIPYIPGLEGVPAVRTEISFLDTENEKIIIRGYDLIELAREYSYLDVAYLVLHGRLPTEEERTQLEDTLKQNQILPAQVYLVLPLLPARTHVMDAQRTLLSYLAGFEEPSVLNDPSPEVNLQKGLRILARLPVLTAAAFRHLQGKRPVEHHPSLSYTANFYYMIMAEEPDPTAAEIFDKVMTCYIEHEMPNSTFTARVIASTLSDIYGAVVGAIASLKGPLHGGANEAVAQMLLEIKEKVGARGAADYIKQKLSRKERIMGFGHRVYMRKYDPRAALLKEYIPKVVDRHPDGNQLYEIYQIVEETMAQEKGLYPNMDYPVGLLFLLLGIPIPLYTPIFLVARTAGLIAHVIEQHKDNRLFRPRVIYEGKPYIPLK